MQERKYGHIHTYGQGLERLLVHTYALWLVYMAGSERRNSVVVVFMGRQQNASCSWGGNGMRRVHGEATECVVFIERQRNAWEPTDWVGMECVVVFIGRAWTEQAIETRPGVPQNGGNGPPTVETGVLLIGRGVAYRKTDETDLLRSKRGSC